MKRRKKSSRSPGVGARARKQHKQAKTCPAHSYGSHHVSNTSRRRRAPHTAVALIMCPRVSVCETRWRPRILRGRESGKRALVPPVSL
eukprot:3810991-Pleurochrysis_carterae.AAC.4